MNSKKLLSLIIIFATSSYSLHSMEKIATIAQHALLELGASNYSMGAIIQYELADAYAILCRKLEPEKNWEILQKETNTAYKKFTENNTIEIQNKACNTTLKKNVAMTLVYLAEQSAIVFEHNSNTAKLSEWNSAAENSDISNSHFEFLFFVTQLTEKSMGENKKIVESYNERIKVLQH